MMFNNNLLAWRRVRNTLQALNFAWYIPVFVFNSLWLALQNIQGYCVDASQGIYNYKEI